MEILTDANEKAMAESPSKELNPGYSNGRFCGTALFRKLSVVSFLLVSLLIGVVQAEDEVSSHHLRELHKPWMRDCQDRCHALLRATLRDPCFSGCNGRAIPDRKECKDRCRVRYKAEYMKCRRVYCLPDPDAPPEPYGSDEDEWCSGCDCCSGNSRVGLPYSEESAAAFKEAALRPGICLLKYRFDVFTNEPYAIDERFDYRTRTCDAENPKIASLGWVDQSASGNGFHSDECGVRGGDWTFRFGACQKPFDENCLMIEEHATEEQLDAFCGFETS